MLASEDCTDGGAGCCRNISAVLYLQQAAWLLLQHLALIDCSENMTLRALMIRLCRGPLISPSKCRPTFRQLK
jgi:hypothetical protein